MKKLLCGVIAVCSIPAAQALLLGDASSGETIHQGKCTACHVGQFGGDGSAIYLRDNRRIKTIEGLMKQVEFCNRQTKANLNDDQVNDVIKYLNDSFYKFE